jgi:plastocyanin
MSGTMGRWVAVALAALVAAACGGGGGDGTPTAPTPGGGGTGGGASTSATITIEANGRVNPSSVTIAQGGRVTFVNNHTRNHDMSSDPHPTHTDCPEMGQVGFLAPGQSRTSGNFNTVRTCGFHDHDAPGDTGLQGRITIVAAQ